MIEYLGLVFMVLLVIAVMVYLVVLGEYRRNSSKIGSVLRDWARCFGGKVQVQKGNEGKIETFSGTHGGVSFSCQYVSSFERTFTPPYLLIYIDCPIPVELEIFREKSINRLSKKIKLDREIQTGDGYFDWNFYLQTSDPVLYDAFFSNKPVRDLVGRLFVPRNVVKRLEFKNNRIILTVSLSEPHIMSALKIDNIVNSLLELARALTSQVAGEKIFIAENLFQAPVISLEKKSKIVHFIHGAFATFGCILYFIGRSGIYAITDGIWAAALLSALIITFFSAFLGYLVLRGASYSRKLVFGLITAYFFANFILSFGALLYFNCHLDRGQEKHSRVTVIEKSKRFMKDFRYHYYLTIKRDGGSSQKTLSISKEMFGRTNTGTQLLIGEKAGRLGFAWVSEVRLFGP